MPRHRRTRAVPNSKGLAWNERPANGSCSARADLKDKRGVGDGVGGARRVEEALALDKPVGRTHGGGVQEAEAVRRRERGGLADLPGAVSAAADVHITHQSFIVKASLLQLNAHSVLPAWVWQW
jgi:hypothetical protein